MFKSNVESHLQFIYMFLQPLTDLEFFLESFNSRIYLKTLLIPKIQLK